MDFYESCVYGKQKRVSFVKTRKENKNEKLELVHTDVWGPAQVSSLGGSHYYITFINDAIGRRLTCLRYDNDSEYCSHVFNDYFSLMVFIDR